MHFFSAQSTLTLLSLATLILGVASVPALSLSSLDLIQKASQVLIPDITKYGYIIPKTNDAFMIGKNGVDLNNFEIDVPEER